MQTQKEEKKAHVKNVSPAKVTNMSELFASIKKNYGNKYSRYVRKHEGTDDMLE